VVFVPGSKEEIREDGKTLSTVEDMQFLKIENNKAVFQVGVGSCHFYAL
jgi:hypothetical protein